MTLVSGGETRWASMVALAQEQSATLRVGDLADQVGYSPFHFSRLFRRETGITPGQYLGGLRIALAKQLLLADNASVVDVATAVGFDSLSSFSRRFRAMTGIPPAGIRQLADRVSDRPPRPFRCSAITAEAAVRARFELAADFSPRGDPTIWLGWFTQPAPLGFPRSGVLVSGTESVDVPLRPGAPYLVAFAVPAGAGPVDQLAPTSPVMAVCPQPINRAQSMVLDFRSPTPVPLPLLPALPALCHA